MADRALLLAELILSLAASLVAFFAYASGKAAAINGRRRTSEQALHLLGMIGGRPKAFAAQRLLRHKSPFQAVFWMAVVLRCGAPGFLLKRYRT